MSLALPDIPGIDAFGPPQPDDIAQAMAIIASQPAPVAPQQTQATYDAPPASAPQASGKYSPQVERWRGLVTQEFQKQGVPTSLNGVDLIDKALYVINGESSGNDKKPGDGGAAYGLFQSHYVGHGASAAAQIADAVRLIAKNPAQWTDWGEGATYQGNRFGALGKTPYNGDKGFLRDSPDFPGAGKDAQGIQYKGSDFPGAGRDEQAIMGSGREIHNGQLLPEGAPGAIHNPSADNTQLGTNLPSGLLRTAVMGSTQGYSEAQGQQLSAELAKLPEWAQQDIAAGNINKPTLGVLQKGIDAYNSINVDVPGVTPAIENYVKPGVARILDTTPIGTAFNAAGAGVKALTGTEVPSFGKLGADNLVPSKSADLALTALPEISKVGRVGEALGRLSPETRVGETAFLAGGGGGMNLERQVAEQAARDARAAQQGARDLGGIATPPAAEPPLTFETSKGSRYEVQADGTTVRDKAARPEHPGDSGIKEPSAKTYYTNERGVSALQPPQNAQWRLIDNQDGTVSLATRSPGAERWGIADGQRNIPVTDKPAVGLHPVEAWKPESIYNRSAFGEMHLGNPITRVEQGAASATEPPLSDLERQMQASIDNLHPKSPQAAAITARDETAAKGARAANRDVQKVEFTTPEEKATAIQNAIDTHLGGDAEVTLYRGTNSSRNAVTGGTAAGEGPGKWWTTDRKVAEEYAGPNGQVQKITAKASDLADFEHANPIGGPNSGEWTLSSDLQRRLTTETPPVATGTTLGPPKPQPMTDFERQAQATLKGKTPQVVEPPTPFARKQAMTEAGIDTANLKTASQIDARWRQFQAEARGGIGSPAENTANVARKAYNEVIDAGGLDVDAQAAARRAAAQETEANRRAAQMSVQMEKAPTINPEQAYGTKLPPISGAANANVVLNARQTAALQQFTDMTKGVIDNHSVMQGVYDAARPLTNPISGAVANSKTAEIIARQAELRSLITRLQPGMTDAEVQTVVRTWRDGMLARSFRGDPAGLAEARKAIAEGAKLGKPGTYDAVSEIWRTAELSGDFAVLGQNLEASLRRGVIPETTGVLRDAAERIATKLNLPGVPRIYLRNDIDHVSQAIADGLIMGGGETADIANKTIISRIPGVGPKVDRVLNDLSQVQYGDIMGTVKLRAYEGLLTQNKILNDLSFGKFGGDITDPLVRRHIAEQANTIGSSARPASMAARASLERKGLLTARMTRAQVNEVMTLIKAPRSQEDAINALNYIGSFAAILGAGKALNDQFGISQFVTDPLKAGFGNITLPSVDSSGRHHVINILPQFAFGKAILQSIGEISSQEWQKLGDTWTRYGSGRLNVLPAVGERAAGYGYDSQGRFHTGDLSKEEALKSALPIPLGVKSTIMQGQTDPASIAFNTFGQNEFPESANSVQDRLAQQVQPDAQGRYPTKTGGAPTGFADLNPVAAASVKNSVEAQATRTAQGQTPYQQAKDVSTAPVIQERDRQESLFTNGQNDKALRDVYHDQGVALRQSAHDLESQFAKTFAGFKKDAYDKAVEGYYALSDKAKNEKGDLDFDKLASLQQDYVASLPSDQQTWIKETLQVSEGKKSQAQKEYDTYIQQKKTAGYFADGLTTAQRTALDIAHPELDAASWKFGSTTGKAGGTLNTPQAVDIALADPLSGKGIPVKYAGLARNIAESEGSKQAWNDNKTVIANYYNDDLMLNGGNRGVKAAATLAAHTRDAEYRKPLAQMDANHRSAVLSKVRETLLDQHPDIEAALLVMGRSKDAKASTVKAYNLARLMIQHYGLDRAAPEYTITKAKDAR